MPVELIIFDCDGVIADSEILSANVLIDLLADLDIAITFDDVRRDFLGRSFPTVAQTIRTRFGTDLPVDFETSYRSELLQKFEQDLTLTPGFQDMLADLDIPVCVATSSSPPRVRRTLEILGLNHYFGAHVFTASQVAHGKPAPDLFLFAANRMLAAPARCVVVEDSDPGIAAGLAAGMKVAHYRGGSHLCDCPRSDLTVPCFDNWENFQQILSELENGTFDS